MKYFILTRDNDVMTQNMQALGVGKLGEAVPKLVANRQIADNYISAMNMDSGGDWKAVEVVLIEQRILRRVASRLKAVIGLCRDAAAKKVSPNKLMMSDKAFNETLDGCDELVSSLVEMTKDQ